MRIANLEVATMAAIAFHSNARPVGIRRILYKLLLHGLCILFMRCLHNDVPAQSYRERTVLGGRCWCALTWTPLVCRMAYVVAA